MELEDRKRSRRPVTIDTATITTVVNENPYLTLREVGDIVGVSHPTVQRHLQAEGYVYRADVWVPHNLNERQLAQRILVCDQLYIRNEEQSFLQNMVTGNEKWIVYNKSYRKSWSKKGNAPQTCSKTDLQSIWWDCKGVIFYELLPHNQMINSVKYCEQLDNLKEALVQKRPALGNRQRVTFHQDNARPYISVTLVQKLVNFSWDVLSHSPYSLDLAPSDYHLFRSLQNSLNGKNFDSLGDIKIHLDRFFESKDATTSGEIVL